MATVITCDPLRGGGVLKRASVNGHQFIEAEILRGGGRLLDTPIASKTDIHSILGWAPADNSQGQEIAGPVTVNFEADNTAEHTLDLDEASDFDNGGTHTQTKAAGDSVELASSAPATDFEDYVYAAMLDDVSQPEDWTVRTVYTGGQIVNGPDATQVARMQVSNQELIYAYDEAGTDLDGGTITVKMRLDYGTGQFGLGWNIVGSGAACHGYCAIVGEGSSWFQLKRVNSSSSWFGLESRAITPLDFDKWYWMKIQWVNTGSQMNSWFKFWEDGTSEPGSFTWLGSDTVYDDPGAVALMADCGSTTPATYFDYLTIEPDPPAYYSNGNWIGDPINVSPAISFSSGILTFDVVTPTDTTAALKCRWGNGDSWLACTSGLPIPGVEYRDDMRTGAGRAMVEFKIELATTAPSSTPTLGNIEIYFDPCDFDDVELVVDGQSATIENGHLAKWGREAISGGVLGVAFDDLTVQAHGFENYRLQGQPILATFKYGIGTIGSINFSQLLQAFKIGAADGYFAFLAGAIEAVALLQYNTRTTWSIAYHDYQWTLIDKTQGIHADAWFWVGHVQADDFPGSIIAAIPELSNFAGSMLVEGYARDDFLGSELVQGYRFDDVIGSILPALEKLNDFLGMEVVAIRHQTDVPGSMLVYGANRRNEIEIQTIDSDTVAELEALGFVFPPEAS
jgi:hypothetical protein